MKLKILAVGSKMPKWVTEGFEEYRKRMPPELVLELIEIPLGKRGKNADVERAIRQEGQAVMELIKKDDRVVALEVNGREWSTEGLAGMLAGWQMEGRDLCFLIGGPDGNAPECQARADAQWSLSKLTLPHPLVRVLLAEQLYRAWSINANHPYHRA